MPGELYPEPLCLVSCLEPIMAACARCCSLQHARDYTPRIILEFSTWNVTCKVIDQTIVGMFAKGNWSASPVCTSPGWMAKHRTPSLLWSASTKSQNLQRAMTQVQVRAVRGSMANMEANMHRISHATHGYIVPRLA